MESISLPTFMVLKSKINGKYLEYVKEGHLRGYVRFTGEDVNSPLSKFQVQVAESSPYLVHLRCCYNNKYLVATTPTQGQRWLVAEADKPEEDRSKWTCTLFGCTPGQEQGEYGFTHLYTRFWPRLMNMGDENPKKYCLLLSSASSDSLVEETFTVIDWTNLVVLPRHVAFKGDNGKFLNAYKDAYHTLIFEGSDIGGPYAAHEVFPNPDGSIRLKSTHCGQFWRRSPNWIWADSSDFTSTDYKDTNFWPVKLDDKTIALRNLGNDRYCEMLTKDDMVDCLNASASTISKQARLEVVEPILSRSIDNVQFHPARARTYNEHPTVMGSGIASNTADKESTLVVKFAQTQTETKRWSAGVSLTLGVTTTLVTKIPFIAEGKVEIKAELSTNYEWGKEDTKTTTTEIEHHVPVLPMTKVTVSAIGSTATCDVPYSYTQTDTLMDGRKRSYVMDDGLFTGINSFNVTYETKHESIHLN